MKNTYERDGKIYRKVVETTIVKRDGKMFAEFETVEIEVKPFWGDGWRDDHKTNPTESAPSFKIR